MKTLPFVLIAAPALSFAVSPFDGSWKTRPGSFQTSEKYVLLVDQNEYRCESCIPPVSVQPDGQFHKVSGHGYDNVAAKIVDPRTVEVTDRVGEKVLMRDIFTASQDGSQMLVKRIDESGEKPAPMQASFKRAAGPAPGANKHSVSGTWVMASLEPPSMPMMLRMTDDSFSSNWNGQHYEAKFDGKPVAFEGDPTHLLVTVKKISANEVEETDTRDGKPIYKAVYSVSPDGKSLKVSESDPRSGDTSHYIMDKQP